MCTSSAFQLQPAIDVAGGYVVGSNRAGMFDAADASDSEELPPDLVVRSWEREGALWLHLVDLDAALGRAPQTQLLERTVRNAKAFIQLSGGIRDEASLQAALGTGCQRVNIAADALAALDWGGDAVRRFGNRLAICLDVHGERILPRGTSVEGGDLWRTLAALDQAGCARYVVTDVSRDGAMTGPNVGLLRQICQRTDRPVIASGGVASLDDIAALRTLAPLGLEGVIVGKALYAGAFTLGHALWVAGVSK